MPGAWRANGSRDSDGFQPMNIQFRVNVKRSEKDDPEKAKFIDSLERKYKKQKENSDDEERRGSTGA